MKSLAVLLTAAACGAAPLTVRNSSFEEDKAALVPSPGNFTVNSVPQWTAAGGAGLFNPDSPLSFAPEGGVVAFLNGGQSLSQALLLGASPVTARAGARFQITCQARGRTGAAASLGVDVRTVAGASVAAAATTLSVPANTTGYSAVSGLVTLAAPLPAGTDGEPLVIVFSNGGGEQINFDAVAIDGEAPPAIASFTASSAVVAPGAAVTLSWSVAGADALTLNGTDVTGQTSATVAPAVTTAYTLVATNSDGTASQTLEVVVREASVRINEVMTQNTHTLADADGAFSDWIELFNAGSAPVDLGGWALTDDPAVPAKWVFAPGTVLAGGAYRVVFASGKDRTAPAAELHTNFRLDADGEYLALIDAGGQPVTTFAPRLPALGPDESHGPGLVPALTREPVVAGGDAAKWLVPAAPVDDAWRGGGVFDDSAWAPGALAFGYDTAAGTVVSALTAPGGSSGTQAYGGALGMDFDVSEAVDVTELGCFDDGGNGIAAGVTITVQLWSRNQNGTPGVTSDDTGAAVLETLTFTQAAPGTLAGAHRFKPLAAPRTLAPGAYTIVGYGYGASERNGNSASLITVAGGGRLAFVGSSRYGTAGSFPATPDGGPATRYGAGSFRFKGALPFATNLLAAMKDVNASVLVRVPFTVPVGANWRSLELAVDADDGFVAWINGVEVGRKNAPAVPSAASSATAVGSGVTVLDATAALGALHEGAGNVLALQGLNLAASDADFRLAATLAAETGVVAGAIFTTPTPGAENGAGFLATHVVINEIHYDPIDSKSEFVEFVELHNPGPAPVDLGGWRLAGAVSYLFPPATVLVPGGYVVVGEDPAHLEQHLGHAGALGPWTGSLSNEGETLRLEQPLAGGGFAEVDAVAYEPAFPWPVVGDDPGPSIQRLHAGLDGSLGGSWRAALPTPGARNTVASAVAPPAVRQVRVSPEAPLSGQPVALTAKVSDPDGVFDVTAELQDVAPGAYIRLTDAAWQTQWTRLPMRDDGTGGDAVAHDGVFTVIVPGSWQQHRHLVRCRIVARDAGLAEVRVPSDDDPSRNFAWFCHDGVPAWTGAVRPGVTPSETFTEATMRKVRPWHLLANAADVQACQYNAAFNDGTYRFEGTLVIDGRVHDHVRYRIKGQNSSFNTGKNKWKFRFNRGRLLEMPDDYGLASTTVRTLNLSSVPAPWAPWNRGMAGLDEAVAFRLANLADSPAPRTSYVHWRVIDNAAEQDPANQFEGDFWGLYLAFENQDNHFKEEHGLADGNIFRMQITGAGNSLLGQGRGQPGNLSDLAAFVSGSTGYNRGSPANLASLQTEAWFRTNVNLTRYFNWRAVTEAINQTDRRDQENVVYYRHPTTGQWEIYSWDVDLLYERFDRWGPQATQSTAAYEQIQRALVHPAIRTEFQNRARELQDLLLNADQAWKVVDEFVSRITNEPPRVLALADGIDPGFVEAERRRWDYWPGNPVPPRGAGATGNYYKTPYPIGNQGLGPPQPFSRTLASADFAGMVRWVKEFIATDAHGGGRLALMAAGVTDPVTLATGSPAVSLPETPVISYAGPPGHAVNALRFASSAYSPGPAGAFSAMEWRVGEVRHPETPGFVPGEPWIYEVTPVWTSGVLETFDGEVEVPATNLSAGRTYRARVRHRDAAGQWSHWSAPAEFTAGPADATLLAEWLVVSEIMYNHPDGPQLDWLELTNVHATASLPLNGVHFDAGVTWSHEGGAELAPGQSVVLAADAVAFQAEYGVAPFATFSGQLANEGERLTLRLGLDSVLSDFSYDDDAPWPTAADGSGASLVLIRPDLRPDPADPFNWRASAVPGGTPGTVGSDAVAFTGPPASPVSYALGDAPVVTFSLTDDGRGRLDYSRRPGSDDATVVMETTTDLVTWHSGAGHTRQTDQGAWEIDPAAPASPQRWVRLRVETR